MANLRAALRLAIVMLLVLAPTVVVPVPVAAEPRCDAAQAMLKDGKLDDAQAAFTALAAFDTDQALKRCGESGLVDVALARVAQRRAPDPPPMACTKAAEFRDKGELDAADAVYRQLSASADAALKKCGEAGLADVLALRAESFSGKNFCNEATGSIRENLDAAEGLFKQLAAATNPQLKDCGERGLAAVAARRTRLDSAGPFGVLSRFWDSGVRPALPGLARIAAVALVLWAVLRLVTALGIVRSLRRPTKRVWITVAALGALVVVMDLLISPSTDLGWTIALAVAALLVVGVWHQAKRVTLQFGSLQNNKTSEVGPEVMSAVHAEFQILCRGPIRGLDVVAGTDQTSIPAEALPDVAGGPVVKTLLTLIQALTPSVAYRLEGQLLGSGSDMGVAVSLRRGRRVVEAAVIRRGQFFGTGEIETTSASPADLKDGSVAGRELSTAIAAWLLLALRRCEGWPLHGLYGATKWESVVAQVLGAEHRQRGDYDRARRFLAVAVDRDPKNLAARFDRASLALATVNPADSDTATTVLEQVRESLMAISMETDSLKGTALSYRLGYQLLAASLHLGLIESTVPKKSAAFEAAKVHGWQLLTALKQEDEESVEGVMVPPGTAAFYKKSNDRAVEDFARQMAPAAILAVAGAEVEASLVSGT